MTARIRYKRDNMKKSRKKLDLKALGKMRVLQRNLVYVTNLPLELSKEEILNRSEYFGQYGKIRKIAINTRVPTGVTINSKNGPSASAYVTFANDKGFDAYHAILAADGALLGGRHIKAAFGTTKYCSLFLKDVECSNPACMYLHKVGSDEDSFSKEDMQAGKHLLRELPVGIPPAVRYITHPDFVPILPPPGSCTRQLQAQQRGQRNKNGPRNSNPNSNANVPVGAVAQQSHPSSRLMGGRPASNARAPSPATLATTTTTTTTTAPMHGEFSWSYAKPHPMDRVLENVVESTMETPTADVPFKSDLVTMDKNLFTQQVTSLHRAYPDANFSFFVSRGSAAPPVPVDPE